MEMSETQSLSAEQLEAIYAYLDTSLIDFDGRPWTIGNAVEGVQIFGGIGSGKTSGSGQYLALKYLSARFGGLVLTVKPDEKERWEKYCTWTGRIDDLVIIEPGRGNVFNILEYESTKSDAAGHTANIVQVLRTVILASEEKASGVGQDPFWENALDMLLFHVVDLCRLADGRVTVRQMYDIVQSAPHMEKPPARKDNAFQTAIDAAWDAIDAQVDRWHAETGEDALNRMDQAAYDTALHEAVPDIRLMVLVEQFFQGFSELADKTRSIVEFSCVGFLFRLLREPVYSLFCRETSNVTPDDCLAGKIILINLPTKLHHKVGQDCQIMFKYVWQRAMEARRLEPGSRAVFLWADEGQTFLHEHDAEYQATARSSMIATVYLSQNLPNYHASMGGAKSDYRVKSFLGTLATKVFHANADIETNRYASELIGDMMYQETSESVNMAGEKPGMGIGRHLKIDKIVRPEEFLGLKTGGRRNGWLTTAYLHFQANVLKDENHIVRQFNQNYRPKPNPNPQHNGEH